MLILLLFLILIVGIGLLLSRQMNQQVDLLDEDFLEKDRIRYQKTPDKAIAFGAEMQWLAIKAEQPELVAASLELTDLEMVNWSYGLAKACENHVFLSPNIDGWVLAVGWGLGDFSKKTAKLEELSRTHDEAQFFLNHEGVHTYAYICYVDGEIKRYFYCEEGEVLKDVGEATDAESSLELNPPYGGFVMQVAAEWSINPSELNTEKYANVYGLGLVGYMRP